MKKSTLLLLFCLPLFVAGQIIQKAPGFLLSKPESNLANKAIPYVRQLSGEVPTGNEPSIPLVPAPAPPQNTLRDVTATEIGTTYYDLQTNGSVYPRLINNGDGTFSAVWTMSQESTPWTDRGTGYNYFNGSTWGPEPGTRVEETRTGFTNVAVTASNAEFLLPHAATAGPSGVGEPFLSNRPAKGSGVWTSSATVLESPSAGSLWPRLVSGGSDNQTLHAIAITTPTNQNPPGTLYHGQSGALLYSRSQDGGATWDLNQVQLPGIDSSLYEGWDGDAYAIDANGNNVAIVLGGFTRDWVLLKSTDNGTTWTKTVIWQFPIPFYQSGALTDVDGDYVADTIDTQDGSLAVLIDDNGTVHCWAGFNRVFNDGTAAGYYYFPGQNGILYWNESMAYNPPQIIAGAVDVDSSGTLDLGTLATSYACGLSSFPSAGIDANGNIYLSYWAIVENTADANGNNLGHSYIIYSKDGGTTWSSFTDQPGPVDYIVDNLTEGCYSSLARKVDDAFIYALVQEDYCGGQGVSVDGSGAVIDPCNTGGTNYMMFISIGNFVVGTPSIADNSANIKMYPVPSDGNFTIEGISTDRVNVLVTNALGQSVAKFTDQKVNKSRVELNLSSLNNGMYTVSFENQGQTISKKITLYKD
ncbi:MAG TPA: T9SS type A sorting domain-containing protein [Chitinophagales bacterium]|nr:T9SS type A sorting domain-containing protein [Chitinophagales bacterium]